MKTMTDSELIRETIRQLETYGWQAGSYYTRGLDLDQRVDVKAPSCLVGAMAITLNDEEHVTVGLASRVEELPLTHEFERWVSTVSVTSWNDDVGPSRVIEALESFAGYLEVAGR